MSKVWRVVVSIVLIAVLFGVVCIGVGLLTGADIGRLYTRINNALHVEMYYNWVVNEVCPWFLSLMA